MDRYHVPVLLKETIEEIRVIRGNRYIDATIGGGGHAFEILRRGGIVLGIDVDEDAIGYAGKRWKEESRKWSTKEENLIFARGSFREIEKIAHLKGFYKVSGIVFDLGVSSHQLDTPERGFSFQKEGPLDMRMDKNLSVKASDLINGLTKGELYELFTRLGEKSDSRGILERIIRARRIKPIETTKELVEAIEGNLKRSFSRISRSTKIFQALRIAVNDELNVLKEALPQGVKLLGKNGRIIAISFHSLEDRIVKRTFMEFEKEGLGKIITRKPIRPTIEEVSMNKRSRSAKLRVFEKN